MSKTKIRSEEAQARLELKRATALQDREGLANLSAATTAVKCAQIFVDMDFALGLMMHAADLPSAKKQKLIEAGREKRLSLLPTSAETRTTVDLVVRIPANLDALPTVAQELLTHGLRPNRRRAASAFAEFQGASDEGAVRTVVERVGGTVTVIVSPSGATADTSRSDQHDATDGLPGMDESQANAGAPAHEIVVSETDPTPPGGGNGQVAEHDAVALDHHDLGEHTHVHHDWHHDFDAGRGSSA